MKEENDDKMKIVNDAIFDSTATNENFDENEAKFRIVFRNVKKNTHVERFSSNFQNSVDENFENVTLMNVNESRSMKDKNRSINSKNQKSLMTRVEKIAIKSTRRNFFEFEHVEVIVETQQQSREKVRSEREFREQNFRERNFRKRDFRERDFRERNFRK